MHVAEIWTWVPLELSTYKSDIRHSATAILLDADGRNSVYVCLMEEDPTRVYLIIAWENPSHRERHISNLEDLRNTVSHTKPGAGVGLMTSCVQFNQAVKGPLDAPTTEITLFTLKEGETKEELERVLLSVIDNHHVANSKYGPMTWGQVQGTPNQFYLLSGWENSQAHRDTIADPSFSHFVVDLLRAVNFESCHCDLSREII